MLYGCTIVHVHEAIGDFMIAARAVSVENRTKKVSTSVFSCSSHGLES